MSDFKVGRQSLLDVAQQCRFNASKPVDVLTMLEAYYKDLGANFPAFQTMADNLAKAKANAEIIEDAYIETAKNFEDFADQAHGIANSVQ